MEVPAVAREGEQQEARNRGVGGARGAGLTRIRGGASSSLSPGGRGLRAGRAARHGAGRAPRARGSTAREQGPR
jgi:hypothetical protein